MIMIIKMSYYFMWEEFVCAFAHEYIPGEITIMIYGITFVLGLVGLCILLSPGRNGKKHMIYFMVGLSSPVL